MCVCVCVNGVGGTHAQAVTRVYVSAFIYFAQTCETSSLP